MTRRGRIRFEVDSQSHFLGENLPYTVRDAASALVDEGRVGDGPSEELPEGYYAVEVVTPSGAPHTGLIHVSADETAELVIGEDELSVPEGPVVVATGGDRPLRAPASSSVKRPATAPESASGTLLETAYCSAVADDDGWTFTPEPASAATPTARFRVEDDAEWVTSLALNPWGTETGLRECHVVIERRDGSPPRPVASFAERRLVSRMLQGALRHRQVRAAHMLDRAAELLLRKYSDPPAAALGGLTLHRLGRLEERRTWVEDLAEDFPWLPDGQVLLAALLLHDGDPDQRSRGLDLLLAAARMRPLFTDGLSLATDLLRRWPGTERDDERIEGLEALAAYACLADWEAVMLTHRLPG